MNAIISQTGSLVNAIMGWPIIFFVIGVSIIVTLSLGFIQLRYFFAAWKYTFTPSESVGKSDMSPFQAFINTLNVSIGNGSLAGMATAIYSGRARSSPLDHYYYFAINGCPVFRSIFEYPLC